MLPAVADIQEDEKWWVKISWSKTLDGHSSAQREVGEMAREKCRGDEGFFGLEAKSVCPEFI